MTLEYETSLNRSEAGRVPSQPHMGAVDSIASNIKLPRKKHANSGSRQEQLSSPTEGSLVLPSRHSRIMTTSGPRSNTFAVVLIDGDCLVFRDEFVQQQWEGGFEAAKLLHNTITELLETQYGAMSEDIQVIIRVFANKKGLGEHFVTDKVITDAASLDLCIRGFNTRFPLCDFVDAGAGKECSDAKIRENLRIFISNRQCIHVFFGGPTDNGYARELGYYSGDDRFSDKLTMLGAESKTSEGLQFASELRRLARSFPTGSVSRVMRARLTDPATQLVSLTLEPPALDAEGSRKSSRKGTPQSIKKSQMIESLKRRKLCNQFHLLGRCTYGALCTHVHGSPLTAEEKQVLFNLARSSPCRKGLSCDSPDCVYGHRCPNSADPMHNQKKCRFPLDMHPA